MMRVAPWTFAQGFGFALLPDSMREAGFWPFIWKVLPSFLIALGIIELAMLPMKRRLGPSSDSGLSDDPVSVLVSDSPYDPRSVLYGLASVMAFAYWIAWWWGLLVLPIIGLHWLAHRWIPEDRELRFSDEQIERMETAHRNGRLAGFCRDKHKLTDRDIAAVERYLEDANLVRTPTADLLPGDSTKVALAKQRCR